MPLSRTLFAFFLPALLLPIVIVLLVVFARLFAAMEHPAVRIIDWTAFALALLWLADLVALVFLLAVRSLLAEPSAPPSAEDARVSEKE